MADTKKQEVDQAWHIKRLFTHQVNRAESGSPHWIPVYYAEEEVGQKITTREETLHQEPGMVDVWHDTISGNFYHLTNHEQLKIEE